MDLLAFFWGLVFSAIIAGLAYWRGSLAPSGALGALVVGALIFGGGGLAWAISLVAFFVTSSALSHYKTRAKEPLAEKFQKGHRRDLGQVLANGGWGALLALAYAFDPHPLLFVAFVGALATVNADTWATELGVLSQSPPRLITTLRVVPVGTSGGITVLGTIVALCGAGLIAILAAFIAINGNWLLVIFVGTVAGLLGSVFDSLLGATAQAIYFCDADQKETESRVHRCGNATRLIRGWRWLDNDGVNFLASVFGSGVAVACYWAIGG
ncbi:MAG: DUF92 domain-containing protein [Chloroflexi bacterium]|nr:DUF92 domain-containing protein [Chloroflexota bacterium]